MGRLLSVSDYGILASLGSLFNIFIVFSIVVTIVFSKFSASLIGQKKEYMIGALLKRGSYLTGLLSLAIAVCLFLLTDKIRVFLHIDNTVLIHMITISLFFTLLLSVISGILQGILRFGLYSIIFIISSLSKFIFGIIFIFFGWTLFGAVIVIPLSTILGYCIGLFSMKKYILQSDVNLALPGLHKELSRYAYPVFLSTLGLTIINTVDIILVKHYFSSFIAGEYAALSLMGRSIFFVVAPITSVFFSLIAQKKERNESLKNTILLSAVLIGIPCLLLSAIYFSQPLFILKIFFPAKEYEMIAPYLGLFSVFIFLYTACYFINSYYLSIGKTYVFILPLVMSVAETIVLVFLHKSLLQIIWVLISVSFLLLILLLLYYPIQKINTKKIE